MSFVFSLKGLLRVREIQEEAELRSLKALVAQVAARRAEIESLDSSLETNRRDVCVASLAGMSGAEWQFQGIRESLHWERRKALLAKLQEMERVQQEQRTRYLHARQQREIVSNLRDRQLAAYNLEESRRTQREIDDLFLIRQSAGRRERKSGLASAN
jgi:flagellar export protein FliJ